MQPSDIVVAIDYSRILFQTLEQEPHINESNLADFLEGTSLGSNTFMQQEGYISWQDQHRLIQNALDLTNIEALGIRAGHSYTLATHGLLGVAATASQNVAESLAMIARFHSTRAQFAETTFLETSSHYVFRSKLKVPHDPTGQFLIEALCMSMKLALEFLAGKDLTGIQVTLACKEPRYADIINEAVGLPIQYDREYSEFLIPLSFGTRPVASYNEAMRELAEDQCRLLFKELESLDTLSQRILTLLRQSPGQRPNQEEMASAFNMSSRTLLRRLKEENTTYQDLVDKEYKRLALHYLEKSELTIEAIAASMGYHDLSSFRRAFKRWFGIPPSQYSRKPVG